MTLGTILPAHRRWCRVLHAGKVEWFRTKPWAETTVCKPVARRNPTYSMVERMNDLGLFYWQKMEREDGSAFYKATLTELGHTVGQTPQPAWERRGPPACTMHELLRELGEQGDGKE